MRNFLRYIVFMDASNTAQVQKEDTMKKYLADGTEIEVALFAKNPAGKSVLVSSDFTSLDLDMEQAWYVKGELGDIFEVYEEVM